MTTDKLNAIRAHYEHRISRERANFDVLDWASAESQRRRFAVLADNVPLAGKSLLDVGCGLADLAAYLQMREIPVQYTGVDVLEGMVAACRERFGDLRFLRADLFGGEPVALGEFDVIFGSGIFNLDLGNNAEFLARAIPRMTALAREYVVFNCLHARAAPSEDGYFAFDPADVLPLVQRPGCEVRLVADYLPNDFTVICRKLPEA